MDQFDYCRASCRNYVDTGKYGLDYVHCTVNSSSIFPPFDFACMDSNFLPRNVLIASLTNLYTYKYTPKSMFVVDSRIEINCRDGTKHKKVYENLNFNKFRYETWTRICFGLLEKSMNFFFFFLNLIPC